MSTTIPLETTDDSELPDNVNQFWLMEDENLKIEYDETHHDNLSDTEENMEVINRFSSSRNLEMTTNDHKTLPLKTKNKSCLFICSLCNKVFSTADNLTSHKKASHDETDDEPNLHRKTSKTDDGNVISFSNNNTDLDVKSTSSESCVIIEDDKEDKKTDRKNEVRFQFLCDWRKINS